MAFGVKVPKGFLKRKDYSKKISEARSKADAKRETPLIEKELGRELRNKPKKKKPASKRQKALEAWKKDVARTPKPKRQGKSVGGDVMGTIRDMARSEGWMTGQDDERDVREYLQTKATNAMFDRAEKKEKKKKAKSKRRKPSKSTLAAARRAAGNIRLKKGGYTSQNKKYGGGIYPKVGK